MKKQLYTLMLSGLLLSFAGCSTDVSIDDLELGVANNFFDTYVTLEFEDAATGEMLETGGTNPIVITFSGPDKSLVMTDGAKRKNQFTVDGGLLPFALDPYAKTPSVSDPVQLTLTVTLDGFLTVSKQIQISESGIHKIPVVMISRNNLPDGVSHQKTANFSTAESGRVAASASAGIQGTDVNVELREGTILKTSAGTPLNGNLTVELTHYDTRAADPSTLFPGGITGSYQSADGLVEKGFLAPAGWIDIEIKDGSGNIASMVESGTIGLTLPVNSALYNPATQNSLQSNDKLTLMSFDPANASWKFEGEATYAGGPMNVELQHLSTWSITAASAASNLKFRFTSVEYGQMQSYFNFNFSEAVFKVEVTPTGGSSTVLNISFNEGSSSSNTLLPPGAYTAVFSLQGSDSKSFFQLPENKSFTVETGKESVVEVPLKLIDAFTVLTGTLAYKKTADKQESIGGNVSFRFRKSSADEWRYVSTGSHGELSIQGEAGTYQVQVNDGGIWKPKLGPQEVVIPEDRLMTFARLAALDVPESIDLLKTNYSGLPGDDERVTLTPVQMRAKAKTYINDIDAETKRVRLMLESAQTRRDVAQVLCLSDKSNQLATALNTAKEREASLNEALDLGSIERADHEFRLISVVHERVVTLSAEANQCSAEDNGFNIESNVVVPVDPNLPDSDQSDNPFQNLLSPLQPLGPLEPLKIITAEGYALISFTRPREVAPPGWVKR